MSVPHFGRITPRQGDMLTLGGLLLINLDGHAPTDDERIGLMKLARDRLCSRTGEDFGFDMKAWHDFLMRSEEHRGDYTHPYAWRGVKKKVLELIDDPDRMRLVRLIEAESAKQEQASSQPH